MTQTSKLLTGERPLIVLPQLAEKVGLNESIILQQIHYMMQNQYGCIKKGVRWIYNSYKEWESLFTWLDVAAIGRYIRKLEKLELIKAGNFNNTKYDRRKWYTITYEKLTALIGSNPLSETNLQKSTLQDKHDYNATSTNDTTYKEILKDPQKIQQHAAAQKKEGDSDNSRDSEAPVTEVVGDTDNLHVGEELPPLPLAPLMDKTEDSTVEDDVNQRVNLSAAQREEILNTVAGFGFELNSQLVKIVLQHTLKQVKDAIAHYRQVVKEKGRRDNPTGWFVDCLRGEWWKTNHVPEGDRYPEGFLDAYQKLIAAGIVQDTPPNQLGDVSGEIQVRVINPNPQLGENSYGLMWWRDAVALLE